MIKKRTHSSFQRYRDERMGEFHYYRISSREAVVNTRHGNETSNVTDWRWLPTRWIWGFKIGEGFTPSNVLWKGHKKSSNPQLVALPNARSVWLTLVISVPISGTTTDEKISKNDHCEVKQDVAIARVKRNRNTCQPTSPQEATNHLSLHTRSTNISSLRSKSKWTILLKIIVSSIHDEMAAHRQCCGSNDKDE